jgi:hypothetical protein
MVMLFAVGLSAPPESKVRVLRLLPVEDDWFQVATPPLTDVRINSRAETVFTHCCPIGHETSAVVGERVD